MTTAIVTTKDKGLTKTASPVREMERRLERARQSRNEKVARADADYVEAVRRALALVESGADTPVPEGELQTTG